MILLTTPLTTKPNTTRTLGLGAIAALFILTACGGGTPATTTTSTPMDLLMDTPMDSPMDDTTGDITDGITDGITGGETPNDTTNNGGDNSGAEDLPKEDTPKDDSTDDGTDDTTDETPDNTGGDTTDETPDDTTDTTPDDTFSGEPEQPDTSCANPANAQQPACLATAICPNDPFNTVCFADETYTPARNAITITETCPSDPFNAICFADETYTPARTAITIAETCPNDPFNAICYADETYTDARTAITVMETCTTDPFNAICYADETYTPARTAITVMETCTTDPFYTICYADDTYEPARNAITIAQTCPSDPFNAICYADETYTPARNAITIAETCPTDPFNAICFADETYTPVRAIAIAETCPSDPFNAICYADDTYTPARTAITITQTCPTDPFNPICYADGTYNNDRMQQVFETCPTDLFNPICFKDTTFDADRARLIQTCSTGYKGDLRCKRLLARPNYATYLQSFTEETLPTTLSDITTNGDIIQIGASGEIDITPFKNDVGLTHGAVSLTADAASGFYYAEGTDIVNGLRKGAAGLLPTTDLGAPLAVADKTLVWDGSYYHPRLDLVGQSVSDVTFFIDLQASTITARGIGFHGHFAEFNLRFDAKGLISGEVDVIFDSLPNTVVFDDYDIVTDTTEAVGLIGQGGLVGVFRSPTRSLRGTPIFGGFAADNSLTDNMVSYADWAENTVIKADGSLAEAEAVSGFLPTQRVYRSNTVGDNYATLPAEIGDTRVNLTSEDLGGAVGNGVTLGLALGEDGARYYYAGLDYTVKLGAPVVETTGTAVWNGWARVLDGTGGTSTAISLEVDYENSAVAAFFARNGGAGHYFLDGGFDARGVITGTAVRAEFAGGVRTGATTGAINGMLSGLIGTDGAVGAFIGGGGTAGDGFAGGFVAIND